MEDAKRVIRAEISDADFVATILEEFDAFHAEGDHASGDGPHEIDLMMIVEKVRTRLFRETL